MPRRSASPIVTIDGPSGSGKGTISRAVARQVGWHLLDSGALYRLVALAGLAAGLDSADERGHGELAARMDVAFDSDPAGGERGRLAGGGGIAAVRFEAAGHGALRVGSLPGVRSALPYGQRGFVPAPGVGAGRAG